ncbi:MAG: hypothetical protein IMZ65_03055 [Planctomycetes bacterium]|nr:hypothetical protein [Planctomycetota bacterium]
MNGIELAIRPKATRVVVFTWPDGAMTWEASAWLRLFPAENVFQMNVTHVIRARNRAMRDLCLKAPPAVTDFIWLDRDMRPGPAALPLLAAKGDLVGATYPIPNMAAWSDPTSIHLGLIRFNRLVAETVKPPWFQFEYAADGCELTQCECSYFTDKVKDAGLIVARAGWCHHDTKGNHNGTH